MYQILHVNRSRGYAVWVLVCRELMSLSSGGQLHANAERTFLDFVRSLLQQLQGTLTRYQNRVSLDTNIVEPKTPDHSNPEDEQITPFSLENPLLAKLRILAMPSVSSFSSTYPTCYTDKAFS